MKREKAVYLLIYLMVHTISNYVKCTVLLRA